MRKLLALIVVVTVLAGARTGTAELTKSEAKMDEPRPTTSATASEAAKIGEPAPDFVLTDTEGREHRLGDYSDRIVVLEWFNPDCPFVQKHHKHYKTMQETWKASRKHEVVWLAINSGAPGKQGHGLERNRKAKEDWGIEYPILIDEAGKVGRLYGAKTTPHMFVIDEGVLVYAGAIDDNATPRTLGETNHVARALDCCYGGRTIDVSETKPYGCTVKYGASAL
jgi:peroxiredoxin